MTLPANARASGFIYTSDRAISLPFYTGTLGLALTGEDPFAATLDAGGIPLRLTTVEGHQPHPHPVWCWDVPDIRATAQALAAKGVACQRYDGFDQDDLAIWHAPGGSPKLAWFTDPEGNLLMLAQR